jgi:hypothetical protein
MSYQLDRHFPLKAIFNNKFVEIRGIYFVSSLWSGVSSVCFFCRLSPHRGQYLQNKVIFYIRNQTLCRTASYKNAPQATDTLSDPIVPNIGNFAFSSIIFKTDGLIPRSSEPITIATPFFKSIS